jgi:predicted homoserine dehydrogenase-like protein
VKPLRRPLRIGVVGTGFVGRSFVRRWHGRQGLSIGRILTRRPPAEIVDFPLPEALTSSLDALIEASDIVLECSGDVVHGTDVVAAALAAGRPVVTANADLHVTTGSWLRERGLLSEAEGDQPGALAAWREQVLEMGFRPLAYLNLKGFLNLQPTPEEMAWWAERQGISLAMVTASTDGTKIQIEQALVANHAGADIARAGLLGPAAEDWEAAAHGLAQAARAGGRALSDYVLCRRAPHGVAIMASHDAAEAPLLARLGLGPGPDHLLLRPNIFVHLEIPRTIRRLAETGRVLMDNGPLPGIGVAAVAKRAVPAGTPVAQAIGGWDFRGIAVRILDEPDHVPIGLMQQARVRHALQPGQIATFAEIELPDSTALRAWRSIRERCLAASRPAVSPSP